MRIQKFKLGLARALLCLPMSLACAGEVSPATKRFITQPLLLADARTAQIEALHDYELARARLERAIGVNAPGPGR